MSDTNPGQFGNRSDTEEQARKGGENSSGQFGADNGADPQEAGRKGGENSGGNRND
ncbi:stress-induced acidophilic repeat motif-containing protein [uncultured Microbacterium sp.]|uniref:stress-induced acidophilic repeat motif-containing protein n=1 Tax=uncultured Microbacterium sp. TaxID=191216 RepID=UPI0025E0F6E5|nr:stress-induced acidophilic repeat motif-containing protein [uncultured Microbacterium sp.]